MRRLSNSARQLKWTLQQVLYLPLKNELFQQQETRLYV